MIGRQFYRTSFAEWQRNISKFHSSNFITVDPSAPLHGGAPIVVYIEASEDVHGEFSQSILWHPMSLISAGTKLCSECVAALVGYGITEQDGMFSAARKLQKIHRGMAPVRF